MCSNPSNKKLAGAVYGIGPGGDEVAEAKTQAAESAVMSTNTKQQAAEATPVVKPTDVGSVNQESPGPGTKNKKKQGYASTRMNASRNVLTDTVSSDQGRTTLG